MGFQQVEFEFPDENNDKIEVEKSSAVTIDVANPNNHLEEKEEPKEVEAKKPEKVEEGDELDLEIVDDTPKEDRGRKTSAPPEDPTKEELESYSESVRNRIRHFTKGYHDERRAKEAALREAQEAATLTERLMEENRKLKQSGSKSQTALLNQAKQNADQTLAEAKNAYKAAYSDGDADKVLEAQEKLTEAKLRVEKLANIKLPPLQEEESSVNVNNNTSKPVTQSEGQADANTSVDERAAKWAKENPWFQTDVEMTGYALGLHNKLVNDGVDPTSDEYYQTINKSVRRVFSDRFDEAEEEPKKREPMNDNVVAPASRSTGPKKVRLTQTQVRLAKRLGLTPEQYAKQVALEMRKV